MRGYTQLNKSMENQVNPTPNPINNNFPEKRYISTGMGILVILVMAFLLFGGVFAYQYFVVRQVSLINIEPSTNAKNSNTFVIDWTEGREYSEHVVSKEAKFTIHRQPTEYSYDKELGWPVIKNIADQQVLIKINNILDFDTNLKKYYSNTFSEFDATENNGITSIGFDVNYDKNNILSLIIHIAHYGAYPDENTINYLINLKSGEVLKFTDIFHQENAEGLLSLLNKKLQNNIDERIDFEKNENSKRIDPLAQLNACSDVEMIQILQRVKEYAIITNGDLTDFTNFKITADGVYFVFEFGFNHATHACEPEGNLILTYSELKPYISLDGLLASEIKN